LLNCKYDSYSIHNDGETILVDEPARVTLGKKKVTIKFIDKKMVYEIEEKITFLKDIQYLNLESIPLVKKIYSKMVDHSECIMMVILG